MDTTQPSKEVLFTVVVPRVAKRWDAIGLALGLDGEAMSSIIKMNHEQDTAKCKAMFNKWLETSSSVDCEQLIEALKSTKFEDVAEDVQVLLQAKKTKECGASGTISYFMISEWLQLLHKIKACTTHIKNCAFIGCLQPDVSICTYSTTQVQCHMSNFADNKKNC